MMRLWHNKPFFHDLIFSILVSLNSLSTRLGPRCKVCFDLSSFSLRTFGVTTYFMWYAAVSGTGYPHSQETVMPQPDRGHP